MSENETLDILTDERRCRDCLEFDQLWFLEDAKHVAGWNVKINPGWCKELTTFTGPDWRICDLFNGRKVRDERVLE